MEKGIRIIQSSVLGRSLLGQSGPGSQSQINYEKELENATLKAAASCRERGRGKSKYLDNGNKAKGSDGVALNEEKRS